MGDDQRLPQLFAHVATLARRGRLEAVAQQPAEARQGLLSKCLKNRIASTARDLRRIKTWRRTGLHFLE